MMGPGFEAVFCIVNSGFAEAAMDAARKAGAGGGTILKGRGTASREAEERFNIVIQPEKELLMLLVSSEIKDQVLRALYDGAGLDSAGQGIAFSLPVEKTVGLRTPEQKAEEADKPQEE
ncbi:MAG: P-II family nitrogen regulator [Oscillospiraceae bacterium]|nr:P-II family nitrogen regulator [Oscillospiraceae bacterium]